MTAKYAVLAHQRDLEYAAHPLPGSPAALGMVARTPDPSKHLVRRQKLRALKKEDVS